LASCLLTATHSTETLDRAQSNKLYHGILSISQDTGKTKEQGTGLDQ